MALARLAVVIPTPAAERAILQGEQETAAPMPPGGIVLAVGGGGTPRATVRRAVETVRGDGSAAVRILVIPFASERDGRGEDSAEMWREEGADAALVAPEDPARSAELIRQSNLIWMGGGSQNRLLETLERLELVDDLMDAHTRGALIGGTSAGAAVLGSVCIAGSPDPVAYVRGSMPGRPGLGFIPNTIIDQHFRERRREGRLLTAILDAGGLRGIGVSESTAVWFRGGDMEVGGEGVAVVFDASSAVAKAVEPGAENRWAATGIVTSILTPPPPAAVNEERTPR